MNPYRLIPVIFLLACAGGDDSDDVSPLDTQSTPDPDGKSDEARACGQASCVPRLCGYDCATAGSQCTETCAAADGRATAFVTAQVAGAYTGSFDSRTNPYDPLFSLDNVLVYGCELWDFSNQEKDGLEIEFEELVHSSFVVDPNDPTRHDRRLVVYAAPFTGPGSYRAEGLFTARHDAPRFYSRDACAVDITTDADHGVRGTFSCMLSQVNGTANVTVQGEFACPVNAMTPIFSRWLRPA